MKSLKPVLFFTVLVLIGTMGVILSHAKTNQKLGLPGVKTQPLPDSQNLEVLLPPAVPDYQSRPLPQSEVVTNMLPPDTSYGQRLYTAPDSFQILVNVVLMGSSRTSLHKPQICLTAQGWQINDEISREEHVAMDKPQAYDLPVMHLVCSRQVKVADQIVNQSALYVYWFVDADRLTASQATWKMWMAHDIAFHSVLDRWAYVSLFAECAPGQENATFERMKRWIAAAVPDFQLVPKAIK
jgi:hypothetical protein